MAGGMHAFCSAGAAPTRRWRPPRRSGEEEKNAAKKFPAPRQPSDPIRRAGDLASDLGFHRFHASGRFHLGISVLLNGGDWLWRDERAKGLANGKPGHAPKRGAASSIRCPARQLPTSPSCLARRRLSLRLGCGGRGGRPTPAQDARAQLISRPPLAGKRGIGESTKSAWKFRQLLQFRVAKNFFYF
ncbi:uncharacterized protein VTP21DRAFT_967 [Calcarisporiella thermophila]|uniref:uncharacterized protein n=1 Tax=Calcarisporiella thermophila TaxID=911321 RepID=UPI003743BE5D